MHPIELDVSVAASSHAPVAFLGMALVVAGVVFVLAERRWRERWRIVPIHARGMPTGPYRSARVVVRQLGRAPVLVRVAALSSLAFGQVFLPMLVFALAVMPFDGIAIALVPGILVTGASWLCGLMLLSRRTGSTRTARSAALASLIANFWLLALCAVHAGLVEYKPNYGISEASNSVPAVAFVFAVASTVHAGLLLLTLRAHSEVLDWDGCPAGA